MALAYIDRTDTLQCVEKAGQVRLLKTKARVLGLENTDFQVLWDALGEVGIPSPPSAPLDELGNVVAGGEMLRLVDREATLVDGDIRCVDVTLTYLHVLDGFHQELFEVDPDVADDSAVIYGKVRCSLQQVTTNRYIDPADGVEKNILVSHTFPKDDPQVANKSQEQGGTINTVIVTMTYNLGGYVNTDDPDAIAHLFAGKVNKNAWLDRGARTWICSEARWECVKNGRYHMLFEFQHNPDGWDPWAVFIDARTGRPPKFLVDGVGKKQIQYLKETAFEEEFGAIMDGWNVTVLEEDS